MKEFTEDEKIIARNIGSEFLWIARDSDGSLGVYSEKPKKVGGVWYAPSLHYQQLIPFNDVFSSIKWEDDEPTRITDIYNPQILDDAEREYLKTILKPFHEAVNYVAKYNDPACGEDICRKEYLLIELRGGTFTFPDFDRGKMYSGMELDKKYQLDELGITYPEE